MTQKRPIVVAGNGPSLARIDYRRLPKEFDTYRVNTFFLEDEYYLGKEVTYYNTYYGCLEKYYPLIREYQINKDYHIQNFSLSLPDEHRKCFDDYPLFTDSMKFVMSHPFNAEYLAYSIKYFDLHPTAGVFGVMFALALGYKEVYVTGIDFFEEKGYAFDINRRPESKEMLSDPNWDITIQSGGWHSSQYERETLKYYLENSGMKLYSINENSKLFEIFPLAPVQNITSPYLKKTSNFIFNIPKTKLSQVIEEKSPPPPAPKGFIQKIKQRFINKGMSAEWNSLRENIYLRLIYHAIKPFWILVKYIFIKGAGNGK